MNRILVFASLVFLLLDYSVVLADETLYKTQSVDGVEYFFKTSPYGATIVGFQKMKGNTSDRLLFPKRLEGRKVTALEGFRPPDDFLADNDIFFYDENAIGFKHVVMPEGIQLIGDEAFEGCKDIVSVDLPNSILYIGLGAFRFCSSLIENTIPRHIEVIKVRTFEKCVNLRRISLPESLREIEPFAFDGCCRLTAPTIPKGVKGSSYAFSDGFACEKDGVAYKVETRGDDEVIIRKAFIFMPITSFVIPETLNERRVVGVNEVECSSNEFKNVLTIKLPRSITDVDSSFFHSFANVEGISIPGVREVDDRSCQGFKKLKTVDISSAEIIGYCAFEGCVALEEVRLPKSPGLIRYDAFEGCANLNSETKAKLRERGCDVP